eukprot:TRINITY_DN18564_c0_g1_i1.p3 TRINITY_DN18564_c0_g1~~TRINITY_DN18564_c0_g1_i1.p3  ORF type:complete len:130 (-),score=1.35 TRINITY_DN18564_c0_g1_i1:615-1004(-)
MRSEQTHTTRSVAERCAQRLAQPTRHQNVASTHAHTLLFLRQCRHRASALDVISTVYLHIQVQLILEVQFSGGSGRCGKGGCTKEPITRRCGTHCKGKGCMCEVFVVRGHTRNLHRPLLQRRGGVGLRV